MKNEAALDLAGLARAFVAAMAHDRATPFLAEWPRSGAIDRALAPVWLPVLRWLGHLPELASDATRTLVNALVRSGPGLHWRQSYRPEDFGAAFLDNYGYTELIGTRGALASDRIAVGFLMLGPEILYPAHRHAAEEIYVPLAGVAEWRRAEADWRPEPVGAIIHHPPWITHATRTGATPLLALYLWRGGDLAQKPAIG